ncbi:MAG: hypothetical protein ACTSXF_11880 [Promethearchaeota archaeon]
MIDLNSHWSSNVKKIISALNKAIVEKDREAAGQLMLELLKLVNSDQELDERISATWAFVEISGKYPKSFKNIIPTLISLLDEEDSFLVNYAINTLDNLVQTFPEVIKQSLPGILKALNNIDIGVIRSALAYLNKVATYYPNILKENQEVLSELRIITKDLDVSISAKARDVLQTLEFSD